MSRIDMLKMKGVDTFKCFVNFSPVNHIKCYKEFIGFGV